MDLMLILATTTLITLKVILLLIVLKLIPLRNNVRSIGRSVEHLSYLKDTEKEFRLETSRNISSVIKMLEVLLEDNSRRLNEPTTNIDEFIDEIKSLKEQLTKVESNLSIKIHRSSTANAKAFISNLRTK